MMGRSCRAIERAQPHGRESAAHLVGGQFRWHHDRHLSLHSCQPFDDVRQGLECLLTACLGLRAFQSLQDESIHIYAQH